ncbi:MAG: hypothetical protein A2431_00040 [Candidatus Zambryskibacteria bacterium RIFOXYC1_FULL_39_10]|uniref:Uncharacterized protein n=1 Tax=Candidatus Zambryskibacteria bacterium RIFOXYC1_FULL_39_10 TaxID=1802779 RepID=A0A1G2UZL2_9BACT|nr:MAG: hypothetical protein A2431_00040 [Candidatus Zambryskibacteria bacterium RIFOXYC1_FULL_39_10]
MFIFFGLLILVIGAFIQNAPPWMIDVALGAILLQIIWSEVIKPLRSAFSSYQPTDTTGPGEGVQSNGKPPLAWGEIDPIEKDEDTK